MVTHFFPYHKNRKPLLLMRYGCHEIRQLDGGELQYQSENSSRGGIIFRCSAKGRLNDMWKFDTIANKWTSLGSSHLLRGRGGPTN